MADLRTRFIEDYAGGLLNVARQDLSSTGEVLAQDGFSDTAETLFVEDGRGVKSGLRLGPALAECVDPSSETGVLNVRSADRTYAKIRDLKVFGTAVASAQAALSESVAESFTNLEDAFEALESDLQGARDQLLTQIESSNLLVQNNERRIEAFEELIEKDNTEIDSLSNRVDNVENSVEIIQTELDAITEILENDTPSGENNLNPVEDIVNVKDFGVIVLKHTDQEPSQSDAISNAENLQIAINTTASRGQTLYLPPGVIWVAKYIIRSSNSSVKGAVGKGASVIKMHGSVHRDMPLCLSSTRGVPQSNIHWSDITFDFNKVRWSRGRNSTNTGTQNNTSQIDLYGSGNIISFTSTEREAAFGPDTGALTQSAFIASDVNNFGSGKRSTYTRIRAINGYKHSIDPTAPSYGRGRGRLLGPRYYDPQPATGIDFFDCYAVGAGDDCITTHQCDDINFYNLFGDVPSGVRTGNTNSIEVDDGSRNVRFYGKTVAVGGTTGMEIKGHSDSPAPHDIYIEHLIAVNCNIGFEPRHLGHHSGTTNVVYDVINVNQSTNTFQVSTNVLEEPLGDLLGPGDSFEIINSTGNNGEYVIEQISVDESTSVTTITIVTDPLDENLTPEALISIPSSVIDGSISSPQALISPTAERVIADRITVIAPRRLLWTDDNRVVYRRNDGRRGVSIKAYRGVEIGTVELYDGKDLAENLVNILPRFLPTDLITGGDLIRPFLRSERLSIAKIIIRGFPQVTYGLYASGSQRGGIYIGSIDSQDGPKTVVRCTSPTNDVRIGGYNIRRNVANFGTGDFGLRLSGENTEKNIGPGVIDGYTVPVVWGGKSQIWADVGIPVGFSQHVSSEQGFIGVGPDNRFGDWYSNITIPQAGPSGYIILADLAKGSHNIEGEFTGKRSSNQATGNHSLRLRLLTSSGSEPARRAIFWDVQAFSESSLPELVYITEGGKQWLAIKATSEELRPISSSPVQFTGRAVRHPDLFRIVSSDAENGSVAASEVPAVNTGVSGTPTNPVWGISSSLIPITDNKYDLGSPSLRFANIYTGDLHLSNENFGNEIDGTWGSYRIQEGENDLYLINLRSGKNYKFVLEEI